MTRYYIDQQGNYYGGDRQHWNDLEVPVRPSDYHEWNGNEWIEDEKTKSKVDEEELIQAKIREMAIKELEKEGKIKKGM